MNVEEYQRHAHAHELLKIITHLTDSKVQLLKAIPRVKNFGQNSQMGKDIEQNIDALSAGIMETITLCAHLRNAIQDSMTEPEAKPLHKLGSLRHYVTPFQRMLEREGVELPLSNTTKYLPTKTDNRQKKLIKLIPYEHRPLRRTERRKGKNYIPL